MEPSDFLVTFTEQTVAEGLFINTYGVGGELIEENVKTNDDGTYGKNHSTDEEVRFVQEAYGEVQTYVKLEVVRQLLTWGVQDHPTFSLDGDDVNEPFQPGEENWFFTHHPWLHESYAKGLVEQNARMGELTWADILQEELSEALEAANDPEKSEYDRFMELVQSAAVMNVMVTMRAIELFGDEYRTKIAEEAAQREAVSELMKLMYTDIPNGPIGFSGEVNTEDEDEGEDIDPICATEECNPQGIPYADPETYSLEMYGDGDVNETALTD